MTGAASLRELLARVEAADGPDRELDAAIHWALVGRYLETDPEWRPKFDAEAAKAWDHTIGRGWRDRETPVPRLTASLDAAVALIERALPGWRWVIHNPRSGLSYGASVADPARGGIVAVAEKEMRSAPLALCAALLKAMLAQADPTPDRAGTGSGTTAGEAGHG